MTNDYEKQAVESLENALGFLSCPLSINVRKAYHGNIDTRELKHMSEEELRIVVMLYKLVKIID